jgi:hypothetical protein
MIRSLTRESEWLLSCAADSASDTGFLSPNSLALARDSFHSGRFLEEGEEADSIGIYVPISSEDAHL